MSTWYQVLGLAPSASHDEVRRAYRQLAQELHPDKHAGKSEAEIRDFSARMAEVAEAYEVLGDPARRAAYDRSLVQDRGDGGQRAQQSYRPVPRPPRPDECLFCGHQPALPITLRRNLGLLITHRVSTLGGSFCRDCGTALFRSTQNRTLIGGWWGLISFFSNFLAIFINFVAWAQLRGLGPPSPPTEPLDVPSPMPMDPGRSVYRRFGFWMVAAIVAFFLLSPGGQASSSSSGSSDVSSSPSATASPPSSAPAAPSYDNSWAVGKCISADATTKLVTGVADCSGPHDATILAIVTSATDCPAATTADFTENPSDPQPGQVVCLDEGQ